MELHLAPLPTDPSPHRDTPSTKWQYLLNTTSRCSFSSSAVNAVCHLLWCTGFYQCRLPSARHVAVNILQSGPISISYDDFGLSICILCEDCNSLIHEHQSFLATVCQLTRRKEMFYLTTHSAHFIYGYMASDIWLRTTHIVTEETRCYHMGYSFPIDSKGSFICTIPQTRFHIPRPLLHQSWNTGWNVK